MPSSPTHTKTNITNLTCTSKISVRHQKKRCTHQKSETSKRSLKVFEDSKKTAQNWYEVSETTIYTALNISPILMHTRWVNLWCDKGMKRIITIVLFLFLRTEKLVQGLSVKKSWLKLTNFFSFWTKIPTDYFISDQNFLLFLASD